MSSSSFEYDSNGNQIGQKTFDKDENLVAEHTFRYDDKGNQVEKKKYDQDEDKANVSIFKYEYDDNGNKTLETWRSGFYSNESFMH